MSKFIGYTIGLECNGHGQVGKLVKIEISATSNDTIKLSAVSGHNLGKINRSVTIDRVEFESRPRAGTVEEAIWALAKCGYTPMALDEA